jgi:hypothetical protein
MRPGLPGLPTFGPANARRLYELTAGMLPG